MLLMIIVTSLITILVLIISSALYLISLITSESDDGDDSDSLVIDTRDFTTSTVTSPLNQRNPNCENLNHHHHYDNDGIDLSTSRIESSETTQPAQPKSIIDKKKFSPVERFHLNQNQLQKRIIDAQINTWTTSVAAQKTILTNQLGAPVSKQLFDDFDQKEMQLGGTSLHWCKSRKSLDKLIRIGLPLDIVNKRQETALHVAVRKKKLPILIGLLGYGCNTDCKNDQGETALLMACKQNDIFACQVLLVFDANVDITDKYGLSPRHYSAAICDKHKVQASSTQPNAAHLILAMLNAMNAKRCPDIVQLHLDRADSPADKTRTIQSPCKDGCAKFGSYNGNSYNRWSDYHKESLYKRHMFSDIIEQCKKESYMGKEVSRLLCIDGGGMRGVIVCQMMIEMEKYLKKPMISYFDWIGGTSVGAFLACALCTGTTLHHLRRVSFDVKDEVFSGSKPYKSKFLERVLKRTFGATTRMSDVKDKKLAVTTVIADRDPCQLRFFKNYRSPGDILEHHGYTADMYDIMSGHSIVTQRRSSSLNGGKISIAPSVKSAISKSSISLSSSGTLSSSQSISNKDGQTKKVPTPMSKSLSVQTTAKQVAQQRQTTNDDDDGSLNDDDTGDRSRDNPNESAIEESERDPLMWQAVRASGAAPFFFRPYGPYLDGGIISNNPTLDMLSEFFSYERVKSFLRNRIQRKPTDVNITASPPRVEGALNVQGELPTELKLVVSLGTGRGRVIGQQAMIDFGNVATGLATVFSPVELLRSIRSARELFKKLMHRSCMTDDHILDRAQAWCSSLNIPYFRVNPPLVSLFSIDDKRDEQLINAIWQTKLYMRAMDPQLKQLADLLDRKTMYK